MTLSREKWEKEKIRMEDFKRRRWSGNFKELMKLKVALRGD